jgi:hypothetical protein
VGIEVTEKMAYKRFSRPNQLLEAWGWQTFRK